MTQQIRKIGKLAVPLGERVRLSEGGRPLERTRITSAEKLGAAMRLRRRELGYTQKTAAALCGHSVRVISEIKKRPRLGRHRADTGLCIVPRNRYRSCSKGAKELIPSKNLQENYRWKDSPLPPRMS